MNGVVRESNGYWRAGVVYWKGKGEREEGIGVRGKWAAEVIQARICMVLKGGNS